MATMAVGSGKSRRGEEPRVPQPTAMVYPKMEGANCYGVIWHHPKLEGATLTCRLSALLILWVRPPRPTTRWRVVVAAFPPLYTVPPFPLSYMPLSQVLWPLLFVPPWPFRNSTAARAIASRQIILPCPSPAKQHQCHSPWTSRMPTAENGVSMLLNSTRRRAAN